MKILIAHNAYQSRHMGGEDLVVRREITGLKKALGDDNVLEYSVSNDTLKSAQLVFSIWGDKQHFLQITQLIHEHKIDLVHVHNFFPLLTPTVFAAAHQAKVKVVQTLHNFRWWCMAGTFNRAGKPCEACLSKKVAWPAVVHGCYRHSRLQSLAATLAFTWYDLKNYLQQIDAFFVLTDFQQKKVKALLPEQKIWLKPNAIDEPKWVLAPLKKEGYLYVGRLESAKGIKVLLSVWQQLPSEFHLTVIGSGEEEDDLRTEFASPNITFLGKMSHAEVLDQMAKAKYFIHSSLAYETFGLTLVEALAQGTPVIAFDIGPRAEFIQSGFNGFLCQPENLLETILNSLAIREYEQLSENAFNSAKVFYADNVMTQQVALYQKILEEAC